MGFLSKFLGKDLDAGNHAIKEDAALSPTHDEVFRPGRPGEFHSIRSIPLLDRPRYFTEGEAAALQAIAKQKAAGVKHTEKALAAMESIEGSDTKVHELYYGYRGKVAETELQKLKANTDYAAKLHGLRPGYAGLQSRIRKADMGASNKIAKLRASLYKGLEVDDD